ncbi:hypothetical protein AB4298_17460 [Shewanella sp. 10N.261.52.F9]|uniref:hypothetical protein n=1 Tax=Shewanella sp. 10N.261.52.F9 TaxID=3229684 RepID=UPI00354D3C46
MPRKQLNLNQTMSIPLVIGAILLFWLFSFYVETDDIRYLFTYSLGSCKLTLGASAYQALCTQNPSKVNLWRASYFILFRII